MGRILPHAGEALLDVGLDRAVPGPTLAAVAIATERPPVDAVGPPSIADLGPEVAALHGLEPEGDGLGMHRAAPAGRPGVARLRERPEVRPEAEWLEAFDPSVPLDRGSAFLTWRRLLRRQVGAQPRPARRALGDVEGRGKGV